MISLLLGWYHFFPLSFSLENMNAYVPPNKSSLSSFLEPSTGDGNGRVSVLQVLIGGREGEINKELCYCEMWYEEQAVKK